MRKLVSAKRAVAIIAACLVASTLGLAPVGAAPPEQPQKPTEIEADCYQPDIGTVETALGVASHVDEVCFDTPRLVERDKLKFYAVDVLISGTDSSPFSEFRPDQFGGEQGCGYGGRPDPVCEHTQATYEDLGVTLWFPRNWRGGKDKTLVQYHFSGGFSSKEGEVIMGLGAIDQGMAYVAHQGPAEGSTAFYSEGPHAGEETLLISSSITRDVASVASDWLERYINQAPDLQYISGYSYGTWVMTGLMAGNFQGVKMANNHVDPDDLNSPLFYDGAIYIGYGGGRIMLEPTVPGATASLVPSIFLNGEQEGGLSGWPYVADVIDLVEDGEPHDYVGVWDLRGEGHIVVDVALLFDDPLFSNLGVQDLSAPVVAAALEKVHSAVTKGNSLPSYFGGEIVPRQAGDPPGDACFFGSGDADSLRRIEWRTVDGEATYRIPVKLHSDDEVLGQHLEPCERDIDSFQRIHHALDPEPAILLPLAANRIGPTTIFFAFDNVLIPGAQFDVCAEYGNLNGYVGALQGTAGHLRGSGVWKPLPGTTGTRVNDVVLEVPPGFPLSGPFPGIVGTFEDQGCL